MKYTLLVAVTVLYVIVLYVGYSASVHEIYAARGISSFMKASNIPTKHLKRGGSDVALPKEIASKSLLSEKFLRKYYSSQTERRRWQLEAIDENSNFATLYNVLVPEVHCPNLVRVGNVNDGGKWVCNPEMMPKENCSIYSLGLREDITFDREIQEFNSNSCKIYGYDLKPQSRSTLEQYKSINGEVAQMKISILTNIGRRESTLGDLLLSHGDESTEFLKVDIEGAEYDTLVPFLKQHQVCQIFVEMHGTSHRMLNLLNEVASLDYMLFFYEVNGDSLSACEYSFVHRDCMERYGLFELGRFLGKVDQ